MTFLANFGVFFITVWTVLGTIHDISSPWKELDLTFGEDRLAVHGMMRPFPPFPSFNRTGLSQICANYENAPSTHRILTNLLGEDSFHPSFVSKRDDTVCFVAHLNTTSQAILTQINSIRSSILIPLALKIHEGVMTSFGLSSQKPLSSKLLKLKKRNNMSNVDSDLLNNKIILTFGIGVPGKRGNIIQHLSIDKIRSELSRRDPLQDISTFSEELSDLIGKSEKSNSPFWISALETFRGQPSSGLCPHSLLDLEILPPNQLVISNLNNFASLLSIHTRQYCLISLLSFFVTKYPLLADIRIRFPKQKFNHFNKGIIQFNSYSENYPYHQVGIDGSGQIIGIGDTGVDELSCYFRNPDGSKVARSSYLSPTFDLTKRKVIQYISYADDKDTAGGHGTHVSGTVAGSAITTTDQTLLKNGGHAPGAKIAFFDMENSLHPEYGIRYPSPLGNNVMKVAYDAGARLHSNSWGGSYNYYDDDTFSVDSFHNTHPDFLAFFAAGNDGAEGYYSIGTPAGSKNSVTVGATMSDSSGTINRVAYFSSLGPTFDERIKPDVVAPGYFTTSAKAAVSTATCAVLDMAGTSMATPLVAGAAAQIRQYFTKFNASLITKECSYWSTTIRNVSCSNLRNPRGATVKALLIGSGQPMDKYDAQSQNTVQQTLTLTSTPDMYQGFGRVSLRNILPYPGIESILYLHVVELNIYPYQQITHLVEVRDISRPFKATLVWMDADNSYLSTKMLLNNVDLRVIRPNGQIMHGNNIVGDEINNVEQVTILTPSVGIYTIILTSYYLVTTSQPISLVVTGGILSFKSQQISTPNTVTYNPNNCSSVERFVVLTALDHGGNGWGSGNSFQLKNAANQLIASGTLASGGDYSQTFPLCLKINSQYTLSLVTAGTNPEEMGIEVSPCNLYLSKYITSSTFQISSATDLYCGACSGQLQLEIILVGSFYGVPYGWNGNSHYTLSNSGSGSKYNGTLITGILRTHFHCLTSGVWTLRFQGVPLDDDFTDDTTLKSYVGIEEYQMVVSDGVRQINVYVGDVATINVVGTTASLSVITPTPSKSPTRSPSIRPSQIPTRTPTNRPTSTQTTLRPSSIPSFNPTTSSMTNIPTVNPSIFPSISPSVEPTISPSLFPSLVPSKSTFSPTLLPTDLTLAPSILPTISPTMFPSDLEGSPGPSIALSDTVRKSASDSKAPWSASPGAIIGVSAVIGLGLFLVVSLIYRYFPRSQQHQGMYSSGLELGVNNDENEKYI